MLDENFADDVRRYEHWKASGGFYTLDADGYAQFRADEDRLYALEGLIETLRNDWTDSDKVRVALNILETYGL